MTWPKRDEDGFVYIVDRKGDDHLRGFNIYPREVEQAIESHPGVAEAAVIGVPDDTWGEAVKALVVLKPIATRYLRRDYRTVQSKNCFV